MNDKKQQDVQQHVDNRAKQLDRNNDAFWTARGYPARPTDWATRDPKLPPPVNPQKQ